MKSIRNAGKQGIRTHVLLVVAMALVIAIVTGGWLLLIRHQLRAQVTENLSKDLDHSVVTFHDLQAERIVALERENSLLAELPTLKALMTSGDDLTIQDGATEFWQLSGNDLFALVDPGGRVAAVYTKSASPDSTLRDGVRSLVFAPSKRYLIDGHELYVCSVRPLYFGSDEEGTLLGYVVSGVAIELMVSQISGPTGAEASFLSGATVVASTLSPAAQEALATRHALLSSTTRAPAALNIGASRFLAATEDLSPSATAPLKLVVLKSIEPAERSIGRIDQMVLSAGLFALLSGTILMIALSRLLTRPLEELSKSVIAFGVGDGEYRIPRYGTQEVRQLSTAFARMRDEINQANGALLESERLATIGRMASSVSHDLRHYLATIYANSEFLASNRLTERERAEIFSDIRLAVHGTTDMIESLLIFSRTGVHIKRSPISMVTLLDDAVALIRSHPDAEHISILTYFQSGDPPVIMADAKQIERAIFSLLLNACQAKRATGVSAEVSATLTVGPAFLMLNVIDNGEGIADNIRHTLFEPFVSEGKQKGTGLGLTLASCIAIEHGGDVTLLSSSPGETIFQLKIPCAFHPRAVLSAPDATRHVEVIEHENLRS